MPTRTMCRGALAACLAVAFASPASPARACWFRPSCAVESRPAVDEVVPANLETLALRFCFYPMLAPGITLTAKRDGESRVIEADLEEAEQAWDVSGSTASGSLKYWMLHIRTPLTPGETLVLEYRAPGTDAYIADMSWPVGDEEPRPEQLGKLDVHQDIGVVPIGHNTSCSRDILSSYADITLQPSPAAASWLGRLRYELRVDDNQPWIFYEDLSDMSDHFWNSALGPGKERLVVGCEDYPLDLPSLLPFRMMPILQPGEHRVRMVGILPDGTELSSDEVTLDMPCTTTTRGSSCSAVTPGRTQTAWISASLLTALALWRRCSRRGNKRANR
jgi:hypothetical protein